MIKIEIKAFFIQIEWMPHMMPQTFLENSDGKYTLKSKCAKPKAIVVSVVLNAGIQSVLPVFHS